MAPGSASALPTQQLIALQRTAGNRAVVQRMATIQRDDLTPKQRATAAVNSGLPDQIADLDDGSLRAATTEERLRMIDILNDGGSGFQRARLPRIWDAFGAQIKTVADSNEARWKKSFTVAGPLMRTSYNVLGQRAMFHRDVVSVAGGYLDMNDRYCLSEFERLGLSETGDVVIGPPTEQQSQALLNTQADARLLAADQEALVDLRKIVVGYEWLELPPGGPGEPVAIGPLKTFDPERPPTHLRLPRDEGRMKTWDEVKHEYDRLDLLIRARMMVNPTLFPLARDAHEDPSRAKSAAGGDTTAALKTIGDGLKGVRENIARTRPLLNVLAPDLEPVHGQLIAGSRQIADRNWNTSPFYAGVAADLVEERLPGPWWQTLGLGAAQMGAYVVAGLATGGTALAIGLAAKGAMETALAVGKAQAMQSAYGATTTEEMSLITRGQVDAAAAAVIETAAFALLDTAFAVGAVRTALREIAAFEKVAAESAARASVEADKWLLKEAGKDAAKAAVAEAKLALPKVQAEADAATKAVADARTAAAGAAPEESARAAAAVQRAEDSAARARAALDDTAAAAAGKRVPRAAAVEESAGMGSKASYDATVRAANKEIGAAWTTMTPVERQTKALKVVADRMRAQGLPEFVGPTTVNTGGASANWQTWQLGVDPVLFNGTHSLDSVVGLIYHEAAHFEDFVRVARLKLGENMLPSQIQATTGIHPRGIQAATAQGPMLPAAAEYARTRAIFESVWGTGSRYRDAVYRNMDSSKTFMTNAESHFYTVVDRQTRQLLPGRTAAEAEAALADYHLHASQHRLNVDAYEKLPEEVRAYGVQEGMALSFERAAFRQRVLSLAAATALVAAGTAASIKILAE